MKRNNQNMAFGVAALLLTITALTSFAAPPSHSRGHHQSGVIGSVSGGSIIATPTGGGSYVVPNRVRVYSATLPHQLVAEVETEVQGNVLWHFEVFLKPGDYMLVAYAPPAPEDGGQLYSYPVPVTVEKRQFTEVGAVSFAPQ